MKSVTLRQMTYRGDPMVRIQLPTELIHKLKIQAKNNKRRTQDQFIKSLADTFKDESAYKSTFEKTLSDLKKVYQI